MSTTTLSSLIETSPVIGSRVAYDMPGILEAFEAASVSTDAVLAVSRCKFGTANIEALVDDDTLAFVHPFGVLCTTGKRKLFTQTLKSKTLDFGECRAYGEVEHTDERGFGKFGIEFAGPGNVLLGRLHWSWRAKRFSDSRAAIMAAAEERDRVLGVVRSLLA